MKYIISGRNINITEGLRSAAIDKISKLERYFDADTEANITMSVEKDRQKIEETIPLKGQIVRAKILMLFTILHLLGGQKRK